MAMSDDWSEEQWDLADAAIRAAAHAILADGPLPIDALTVALAQGGVLAAFDEYELDELVEIVDEALIVTDDTWHSRHSGLVSLISERQRGVVLTHRVTPKELERGVLDSTPDLGFITWGIRSSWTLAGGGDVTHEYPFKGEPHLAEHGSYVGPQGWLDGIEPNELIGVTVDSDGFEIVRNVTPDHADQVSMSVRDLFDELCDPDSAIEPDELIFESVLRDVDIFRTPTAPFAELIEQSGLRLRGAWIGRADREFTNPGEQLHNDRLDRLVSEYQLDTCCREALERVMAAWGDFVTAGPERMQEVTAAWNARRLRDDFHHGAVSPALVDEILERHDGRLELLDNFAAALSQSRELEPIALYFVAHNALRGKAAGEAFESVRRSTTLDGEFGPALDLYGTLLADAGQPVEALSMRRKGLAVGGSDHDVEFLSEMLAPFARAGRNDTCPCGSGRKFKQCCQHEPKLSVGDRRSLALRQAIWSLDDPQRHNGLFSLAMEAFEATGAPLSEMMRRVPDLMRDSFVISLAMFEDGALDSYVHERAEIIPAPVLEWLQSLSDTRRPLWEYRRVDGNQYEVRDVRTGAVHESITIHDPKLGDQGYLLGRVLLDGADSTPAMVGPIFKVSLSQREGLIALLDSDPDALELAAWYGELMRPPTVQNREGDPLSITTAYFSPAVEIEWQAIEAALHDLYERDGEGWTEHLDLEGEQIVRASMRREGDHLAVETNSVARFERIRDVLVGIGLECQRSESPDPATVLAGPAPAEMEIPEADLDRIRDEMEDRWLREHVPAFDGLTPREAVDDPTRRDDVIKIIEDMERRSVVGFAAYDVDRLRAKLGLTK